MARWPAWRFWLRCWPLASWPATARCTPRTRICLTGLAAPRTPPPPGPGRSRPPTTPCCAKSCGAGQPTAASRASASPEVPARTVLEVEAAQERLPGAVHRISGCGSGRGPRPLWFRVTVARQVVYLQPDEGAVDDRQFRVVVFPAGAAGQPLVQPAPCPWPGRSHTGPSSTSPSPALRNHTATASITEFLRNEPGNDDAVAVCYHGGTPDNSGRTCQTGRRG